jgi:hypothetical protein
MSFLFHSLVVFDEEGGFEFLLVENETADETTK